MKSKIRLIVLIVLILLVSGYFYVKYFYHPAAPSGQAVLTWNASSDDKVWGYKIYYGTDKRNDDCPPGGYSGSFNAGKKTKFTIKNLEEGKTYYFSITSYNASGKESCFSEETKKIIDISIINRLKRLLKLAKN